MLFYKIYFPKCSLYENVVLDSVINVCTPNSVRDLICKAVPGSLAEADWMADSEDHVVFVVPLVPALVRLGSSPGYVGNFPEQFPYYCFPLDYLAFPPFLSFSLPLENKNDIKTTLNLNFLSIL